MWKLLRRRIISRLLGQVKAWISKELTKEKLQGLIWEFVADKLDTKKMVLKVAPSLRQFVLDNATVDASGKVQFTAAAAQAGTALVYRRTKEQMQ